MSNPEKIGEEIIQKVKLTSIGTHNRFFAYPLTDDGLITGNSNMGVDGSIVPVRFSIKPPAGVIYYITRLIFYLRDAATIDSGGWGNNGGVPLTNGLLPYAVLNGDTRQALVAPIKSHGDLAAISYDINKNSWGAGDEFIVSRLTFTKFGSVLVLNGDNNDEWYIDVSDDLSYLTSQVVTMEGFSNLAQ